MTQTIDHQDLRRLLMKPQSTFSPISLRYVAALRGNKPKPTGKDFTYAEASCSNPEKLTCLAASNPEGRFYGFVADDTARRAAEMQAAKRGVYNIVFLVGAPSEMLARIANGSSLPPMLDYLCCDETEKALSPAERTALFDLAQKRLNTGGLFTTSYRPHQSEKGALQFLVKELAPEMNADQKQEFLVEIKRLGSTFLSKNKDIAAKLNDAIVKGTPDAFFADYLGQTAASGTFDTMIAMGSRGLVYAGDATLISNYVELAVPAEAQALVVKCRNNILYEPIKDLALDRTTRSDIWIKEPAARVTAPAELFGGFAYGITMAHEDVPSSYAVEGKTLDLSSPLYRNLIDLMAIMPIGIGDFLAHPKGEGENVGKILEALQVLVACGIASPMRGQMTSINSGSIAQPRLVGNFNRYLDQTSLSDEDVWFSSQVLGCGVKISAREALVMQALNRAGLSNSVSALMPELRRIAPTGAVMTILKTNEPTAELAQSMIKDVVGKSLPQWYAYALLEAA